MIVQLLATFVLVYIAMTYSCVAAMQSIDVLFFWPHPLKSESAFAVLGSAIAHLTYVFKMVAKKYRLYSR